MMSQEKGEKLPDKAVFERDGYYLLPELFKKDDVARWRAEINNLFGFPGDPEGFRAITGHTFALADGVTTQEQFWPIIFNEELLKTVRALIGRDIRYTQHSDLHINLPGGRWHRDNAFRDYGVGPDWDESHEPYRVVRVAIYLSEYSESNSSLVVLPGSHKKESKLNRLEYVLWNRLRTLLRQHGKNDWLSHNFLTAPCRTLKTHSGDCVIFDQRLMHAGGIVSGPKPKHSIFLSFGINNTHSRNHRAFFLNRPTYNSVIPTNLYHKLSQSGLLLDHSN
jgi:hypothetical protein